MVESQCWTAKHLSIILMNKSSPQAHAAGQWQSLQLNFHILILCFCHDHILHSSENPSTTTHASKAYVEPHSYFFSDCNNSVLGFLFFRLENSS